MLAFLINQLEEQIEDELQETIEILLEGSKNEGQTLLQQLQSIPPEPIAA